MIKKYILILAIILSAISSYSFAVEINILSTKFSANSVMRNDCNRTITNPDLIDIRYGEESDQTFWNKNDFKQAYNNVITSTICNGNQWVTNSSNVSTFIDSLCNIWLEKAAGLGSYPYPPAKELRKFIYDDGTNPEGIIPWLVLETYIALSGKWIPNLFASSDIATCGQIFINEWDGISSIYAQLIGSIRNINGDCGNINNNANEIFNLSKYKIFWFKWGNINIDVALQRCLTRINLQQKEQQKQIANLWIIAESRYINTNNQSRNEMISRQIDTVAQEAPKSTSFLKDGLQQTPTTATCQP